MVFALQGFTKEFIALQMDGIGVEYAGRTYVFIHVLLQSVTFVRLCSYKLLFSQEI